MKVGRNDPCPCRNGKKFKHCHMEEATVTTEKAHFFGTPGPGKTSVNDWPAVDEACKSAMPVVFSVATAPEFPGTNGTCFGVRLPTGVVLVTAAHVVRDVEQTKIEVPIAFGEGHREVLRIAHIDYLTPSAPEFEDACDVAVMVPMTKPPTGGQYFRPVGIETIANVETMKSPQLYAVAGYPRHHPHGNSVDYERKAMTFRLFHAIGTYESKAAGLPGCHTLKLSTEPVGGAQGLSGSPVFRVVFAKSGSVSCALAGMVIRGNVELVHFIGVDYLAQMLRTEQAAFFDSTLDEVRLASR